MEKENIINEIAEKNSIAKYKQESNRLIYQSGFQDGAKSDAAKQYHSAVDSVEELREKYDNRFLHKAMTYYESVTHESVFEWFINKLPYLQKKDSGAEAVEFAEWCEINGWEFIKKAGNWRNKNGIVIIEYPTSPLYVSGKRLFQEYLKTKAK